MTLVPAPMNICSTISTRAAQMATEQIKGYGWSNKSLTALTAYPDEGWVGIRTSVKYLMRQEQGVKPFLMWWVQDRTLPMACGQGDGPHFRRGSHVGEPGMVNIPHKGQVWREQRWRYPGLEPKNFMKDSILRAIKEMRPQIQNQVMHSLKGGKP
jgi:hypothetical protein